MGIQLQGNNSKESLYAQRFIEAQKNLTLVCKEYRNTPLCRKTKKRFTITNRINQN